MSAQLTHFMPDVHLVDGTPKTTSLNVAEVFRKQHAHVLRTIKELDCSDGFRQSNFGLASYIVDQPNGGQANYPMYELTRDGFTFLAMGFTGKEAARFKEAYIALFNEMSAKLLDHYLGRQDAQLNTLQEDFQRKCNMVEYLKEELLRTEETMALLRFKAHTLEQQAKPKRVRITPEQRADIIAKHHAGLTDAEIANRLNRPVDTIKTVLYQARKGAAA